MSSPAYRLVELVWKNSSRHRDSWIRLNQALASAVVLAIEAGLKFAPGDFNKMYEGFRGGYWFGRSDGRIQGERFYGCAVRRDNLSACIAFERYAERKPFILDTGARVAIGTEVVWEDLRCVVTSFRRLRRSGQEVPDVDVVGLSHYKTYYSNPDGLENVRLGEGTPIKRFSIERVDWLAEMKRRREAKKPKPAEKTAAPESAA